MAEIKCSHCKHPRPLGSAATNRCPNCNWIVEIYTSHEEAERVAQIYNEQKPTQQDVAGVGNQAQKGLVVLRLVEDLIAAIPSIQHVVTAVRHRDARRTRHPESLRPSTPPCQVKVA